MTTIEHDQTPAPANGDREESGAAASRLARLVRRAAALGLGERELLGLAELVGPGDVCFDVGAGYGAYTFPLAELVGPTGRVYSFEPLPVPHRILTALVDATSARRVHVHRAALGPQPGTLPLTLPYRFGLPIHGWAHLNSGRVRPPRQLSFSATRTLTTPVHTVDEICERHRIARVAFLKIDVEGFESAVLAGAEQTLRRDRPTLLLEIEDRHLDKYGVTAAELVAELRDRDYTMSAWRDGRWTDVTAVTTAGRNYLFRPLATR